MLHKGREVEIKLPVSGPSEARMMLRAAGFRVFKRRVFENNTVFDDAGSALGKSARLLRLREIGKAAKLTYKGPPENGKHKSREELEVAVADAGAIRAIFNRLAFHPVFRYQKFRTEFRQRGSSGTATLDETPIGTYMELEGSPQWIDRTARKLGFAESDYITASYGRLYLEWCKSRGAAPTDMLFS